MKSWAEVHIWLERGITALIPSRLPKHVSGQRWRRILILRSGRSIMNMTRPIGGQGFSWNQNRKILQVFFFKIHQPGCCRVVSFIRAGKHLEKRRRERCLKLVWRLATFARRPGLFRFQVWALAGVFLRSSDLNNFQATLRGSCSQGSFVTKKKTGSYCKLVNNDRCCYQHPQLAVRS